MTPDLLLRLDAALDDADPEADAGTLVRGLVRAGLARLPRPGSGATLLRWRALARVARHDLSLVKLYEAHTDAMAILSEIGHPPDDADPAAGKRLWAVWAAEAPSGRTLIDQVHGRQARLVGTKCWCSGADDVDDALVTAWFPDGDGSQLVRVQVSQPRVSMRHDAWQARGMAGAISPDLDFDGAEGRMVGATGDYVSRPGFSQGGAGVAACWYGGAVAVADVLRQAIAAAPAGTPGALRLAALGRVGLALDACAAVLREAADWIDRHPTADASTVALRTRLAADGCARQVLDEVGRAVGPGPFCRDPRFARFAVDLPIFIRQCQGDRDFEALGRRQAAAPAPWEL